jgi:hypothetical protein
MKLKPMTVADIAALAACYREIDAAAKANNDGEDSGASEEDADLPALQEGQTAVWSLDAEVGAEHAAGPRRGLVSLQVAVPVHLHRMAGAQPVAAGWIAHALAGVLLAEGLGHGATS